MQKQPSVSVLGMKRSNIITIALSRLPPPRLLPPAIYSMDSSVLDREDVQVQFKAMFCRFMLFSNYSNLYILSFSIGNLLPVQFHCYSICMLQISAHIQ